ncbi:MAG: hypothetical protein CVT99_00145 [Bacteroidetes bacterium HGW-Bacteroidetes-16]|jgi:hypothetical protein|nr:MAG: hypothetical protein CVT99_00145 [Bacteroidetes bacterium HGW-Bacteroidetes-16]
MDKLFRQRIQLLFFIAFTWCIISFSGCDSKTDNAEPTTGKLTLHFSHKIDSESIVFDDMRYVNAAGNHYLVNEIQYFISDVTLFHSNGTSLLLDQWEDIHYVDTDLPETQNYIFKDDIPQGIYDSISFTFGISEEKNHSLMFVNPPESFMFWPENLGGGYHYLKLNGKWLNELNQEAPFNFHLGIGQIYHSYPDSITSYVQNYFTVHFPVSAFGVKAGETQTLELVMNVENWFQSPNIYNHDTYGGDIMQKQEVMALAVENGWNVFSIEFMTYK